MTDRNCEILYEYIQDILSDRQAQAPDPASMDACHRKLGEGLQVLQKLIELLSGFSWRHGEFVAVVGKSDREVLFCSKRKAAGADLRQAGVEASVDVYPFWYHGFDLVRAWNPRARRAAAVFEEHFRYALAHYSSMTVTVWTFLFAGPASLALVPGSKTLGPALSQPEMWLTAAGLVVFSTVLPYIFYTKGLSRVEPGKASIMASLEPVVAALAGILAFGEPMNAATVIGIVCVLAGVVILR